MFRDHKQEFATRGVEPYARDAKGRIIDLFNETGAVTTPNKETVPTTVGKIDVSPPGFTFLQTARIRVKVTTVLSKLTRCFGRRQSVKRRR